MLHVVDGKHQHTMVGSTPLMLLAGSLILSITILKFIRHHT